MKLNENCILIADDKIWIEQAAKDQLLGVSRLKDVKKTVGLPDLHAGKSPVGMGVLTSECIYPHLIGNDIGCGMGLFHTGVKPKKFRIEKVVTALNSIRSLSDIYIPNPYTEESPISDLGTIGGGNHFAEFQTIHEIMDEEGLLEAGISKQEIVLLVHTGSRGYGQSILRRFLIPEGLKSDSEKGAEYRKEHDNALLWAKRNRFLAACKLMEFLGYKSTPEMILDTCHNYIEETEHGFLHRKGAVSSKTKFIVIPGSRGSLTYLCRPAADTWESLDTLSHGSGRKWARSICKSRIDKKYDKNTIRTTAFKSHVVCHDTNLLYQEAPEAYKKVEDIIRVLVDYKLIQVVAAFKPIITFKG